MRQLALIDIHMHIQEYGKFIDSYDVQYNIKLSKYTHTHTYINTYIHVYIYYIL